MAVPHPHVHLEATAQNRLDLRCSGERENFLMAVNQGRFWILHLQKACCGRRCKFRPKDGRGSTVSGEVKSSFMISACAASVVSICIKICQKNFQLSFVFSYCIRPWQILTSEVWVHTTNIKNFCISSCKFWHQRQHELRSLIKMSRHQEQCFLCHLLTRVYNIFHNIPWKTQAVRIASVPICMSCIVRAPCNWTVMARQFTREDHD